MNDIFRILLTMSASGSLLILVLLLGKPFWKNKISRQWQYYIWLPVLLRLLLPFGPEVHLPENLWQAAEQAMAKTVSLPRFSESSPQGAPESNPASSVSQKDAAFPDEALTLTRPLREAGTLLIRHLPLVWLAAALGLLIRRITAYQDFIRYVHAGSSPVTDVEMLDRLSAIAEGIGVKKPVELCVNPLVSSPMLIGFFRPCIVLPDADLSEKDFRHTALHELTHYKRRDLLYKWLAQVTVCLHWFNPLAHLMGREITRACEFSCDEAVLARPECGNAGDYGKTLLDAMAAAGRYQEHPGALTLSENKRLLKERLKAIRDYQKKPVPIRLLTGILTLCFLFGAAFLGISSTAVRSSDLPRASAEGRKGTLPAQKESGPGGQAPVSPAEEYVEYDKPDRTPPETQEHPVGRVWHPLVIPVHVEAMEDGEIVWLEEYTLSQGDRLWYAVSAEVGNGLQVGFAKPGDNSLSATYYSVANLRQEQEPLECIASFTLRPPAEAGTWQLFLRATDGPLENVAGSISIGFVAEASFYASSAPAYLTYAARP